MKDLKLFIRLLIYIFSIYGLIKSNDISNFIMWLLVLNILRMETNFDTIDEKLNIIFLQQKADSIKLNEQLGKK